VTAFQCLWLAFAIMIAGSLLIPVSKRHQVAGTIGAVSMVTAGLLVIYVAVEVWIKGTVTTAIPGLALPGFPAMAVFAIDRLSALFLGLLGILGIASVIYSQGYVPHIRTEDPRRYYIAFLVFILAMMAVVVAADLFYFLVFWEIMTLASYFLVIYQRDDRKNLQAGWLYFFMTHVTSMGILLVVVMLGSWTNSLAFTAIPGAYEHLAASNPAALHLIIGMLVVAFATKAGIYPLGFWFPEAHPAAPAPISALLSGIMNKVAVYGLLRLTYWMLPPSGTTTIWGAVIATAGVLSMIVGNLRCLGESDAKRLVAQSTIGQMGYIWLGMGIALMFLATNPLLSILSLVGALYHLINDACFKSLLFFNAGSIDYTAGERDLNKVSGLIKIMPLTAAAALVGSLAIAGVPPLNGFMSKWMLYQAAMFGGKTWPILAFFGVVAIFMSTVSLAAYLKFFGAAFLGPVSPQVEGKKDLPLCMRVVEGGLALGCLILGVIPAWPVAMAQGALNGSYLASIPSQALTAVAGGVGINLGTTLSAHASPAIVLIALVIGVLLCYGIYRLANPSVRPSVIWSCGEIVGKEELLYRADSFYQPFKKHFAPLYRVGPKREFKLPNQLAHWLDLDNFWLPLGQRFMNWCRGFSKVHGGRPREYLLWQAVGLGLVLVTIFWLAAGN
jgi:hydrogenase-4 component B